MTEERDEVDVEQISSEVIQLTYERPYFESYYTGSLTPGQIKVLEGAKKVLGLKAKFDTSMVYRSLKYKHGVGYIGREVYPGGDINPTIGVCTDVIVRTLRFAGVADLQKEIHEGIRKNPSAYPLERWSTTKSNRNIDHRRVPNQHVWFLHNWTSLSFFDFQPGDVVIWDLDGDKAGDHIGIISDRLMAGIKPYIIHSSPEFGHIYEADVLRLEKMIGHFRIKE